MPHDEAVVHVVPAVVVLEAGHFEVSGLLSVAQQMSPALAGQSEALSHSKPPTHDAWQSNVAPVWQQIVEGVLHVPPSSRH